MQENKLLFCCRGNTRVCSRLQKSKSGATLPTNFFFIFSISHVSCQCEVKKTTISLPRKRHGCSQHALLLFRTRRGNEKNNLIVTHCCSTLILIGCVVVAAIAWNEFPPESFGCIWDYTVKQRQKHLIRDSFMMSCHHTLHNCFSMKVNENKDFSYKYRDLVWWLKRKFHLSFANDLFSEWVVQRWHISVTEGYSIM